MLKGRVQGMLRSVPIYAVMVEDLGERGAHYMAYKEFCKEFSRPFCGMVGVGSIRDSNKEKSADDQDFDPSEEQIPASTTWVTGNVILSTVIMFTAVVGAYLLGGIAARSRK